MDDAYKKKMEISYRSISLKYESEEGEQIFAKDQERIICTRSVIRQLEIR